MKKLLSILLCMMLITSLIPISASATETTESTDGASLEVVAPGATLEIEIDV